MDSWKAEYINAYIHIGRYSNPFGLTLYIFSTVYPCLQVWLRPEFRSRPLSTLPILQTWLILEFSDVHQVHIVEQLRMNDTLIANICLWKDRVECCYPFSICYPPGTSSQIRSKSRWHQIDHSSQLIEITDHPRQKLNLRKIRSIGFHLFFLVLW